MSGPCLKYQTFFASDENRGRFFTILKKREGTYTNIARVWERGYQERPRGP
jgi:hypothetical protein